MNSLGRGELRMRVASRSSPERAVAGLLGPRYACDLFDTVLSADDDGDHGLESATESSARTAEDDVGDEEEDEDDEEEAATSASGIAWMFMRRGGEIEYHVR